MLASNIYILLILIDLDLMRFDPFDPDFHHDRVSRLAISESKPSARPNCRTRQTCCHSKQSGDLADADVHRDRRLARSAAAHEQRWTTPLTLFLGAKSIVSAPFNNSCLGFPSISCVHDASKRRYTTTVTAQQVSIVAAETLSTS